MEKAYKVSRLITQMNLEPFYAFPFERTNILDVCFLEQKVGINFFMPAHTVIQVQNEVRNIFLSA